MVHNFCVFFLLAPLGDKGGVAAAEASPPFFKGDDGGHHMITSIAEFKGPYPPQVPPGKRERVKKLRVGSAGKSVRRSARSTLGGTCAPRAFSALR